MKYFLTILFVLLVGCTETNHPLVIGPSVPTPVDFQVQEQTCGVLFTWNCATSPDTSWWFHIQCYDTPTHRWVDLPPNVIPGTEYQIDPSYVYWSTLADQSYQFRVYCTDGDDHTISEADIGLVECTP